ncbi:Flagellin protein FlaA [hydrothermal vent metagenome]|uniref:Flagellin protein FlaA n=1 Tax=hydrothermal vent metagenome TaxID=652676 RepID=A0A3B1BYG4_9ZZZZ
MALRVYNNIFSLTAQRNLGNNSTALGQSLERLSSGIRINRGADDAAGLAISEALRADIRSLQQALRNANDGISMINTAEGALSEQAAILVRMRELAAQAATGTVGSTERTTINREFTALRDEIDRISAVAEFNGQKLTDGALDNVNSTNNVVQSVVIQVGMQANSADRINLNAAVNLTAIDSTGLNITNISVDSVASALDSLSRLDSALSIVTEGRGKLGAVQNRLVHTINNLAVSSENLQAAESAIRDADYAQEISQFTRNQILVQASTAILAQANLVPQTVLQLLG